MTTIMRAAVLPAVLLALAVPAAAADFDLAGTSWRVQAIGKVGLPAGVEASLAFAEEGGRVGGSTGCNRLVGTYEQDGTGLTFGPPGTTMMACPDAQMRTQRDYVDAIERTRSFRAEDVRLILLDGNGDPLMTLARDRDG